METVSLRNIRLFELTDQTDGRVCYGLDQEWYRSEWQRRAGCGPTTVATILSYLGRSRGIPGLGGALTRADGLALMEKTWRFVTPTDDGIPSAGLLCRGVRSCARALRLPLTAEPLDIPGTRGGSGRPPFPRLLSFLRSALEEDSPPAFLNLHSGEEERLAPWHWVTVAALSDEEDGSSAFLDLLDEGEIKRIDLAKWFRTTRLGGGFVRFHLSGRTGLDL